MSMFEIATILMTLAAVFGYVNYRFIPLAATIGVMLIALLMSLGLIALHELRVVDLDDPAAEREVLVAVIYAIVSFSILVQGLTLGPLIRRSPMPRFERHQRGGVEWKSTESPTSC